MSMLMCLAAYLRQVWHRSPPYHILTWWRGGVGREAHRCIKTWNGGLLLYTEALHVMFDTMEGWVDWKVLCRIETWEGGWSKMSHYHVETQDGAVTGCGKGWTGKIHHTGRVSSVWHVVDMLGEEGDMLEVVETFDKRVEVLEVRQ